MGCENMKDKRKDKLIANETEQKINNENNINNNNIIQENITNENNSTKKELENNSKNLNLDEEKIFLICPDCQIRSPHIEKIYVDDKTQNILVKYTCICHENNSQPKEIILTNILSNKEPTNTCDIHPENKLINFCKTCKRAICQNCKEDTHKEHEIEDSEDIYKVSKEDADKMLDLIKYKKEKFNEEIKENEEKMSEGFNEMIKKLNEDKENCKKKYATYKDNNLKNLNFIEGLYQRYLNDIKGKENINSSNQNNPEQNSENGNNVVPDVMLNNHLKIFSLKSNQKDSNLNTNLNEIMDKFKNTPIELNLKYDYGFPNVNTSSQINPNRLSNNNIENIENKEFKCYKTYEGHTEKIVSLIQLSSGELVSGSYDNRIYIWDLGDARGKRVINEDGRVFSLLEFENGKLLCGTSKNVINLWDIQSEAINKIFRFEGHELWVNCLVKCTDEFFASASNDSKIKIWDYNKRKCISTLKGHGDCILSLILLKNNFLCSGAADLTIRIWDWQNEKCLKVLKGHEKWVKCIYELDNGIIVSGSDDKTIKLWKDDKQILTLVGHNHSIRALCQINPKYFASASFDCTIKIWEIDTWKCIQTLLGHISNIICVIPIQVENDNEYSHLASCSNDKTIKLWKGIL